MVVKLEQPLQILSEVQPALILLSEVDGRSPCWPDKARYPFEAGEAYCCPIMAANSIANFSERLRAPNPNLKTTICMSGFERLLSPPVRAKVSY